MLAARILGWKQVSLAALLETHFDVTLDKRAQLTDWGHRPLTAEQLSYARLDTHHLLALCDLLEQELSARGRQREARDVFDALPTWSQWNTLYPEAEGEIRIGATLNLRLALPGQPERMIQPVVLDWVPHEQLHWRLSALGGLVTSVRFIEIESMGPQNAILSNGEIFGGLLGGVVAGRLRKSIRRGFTEMGEALAARAEARWREQGGVPKSEP